MSDTKDNSVTLMLVGGLFLVVILVVVYFLLHKKTTTTTAPKPITPGYRPQVTPSYAQPAPTFIAPTAPPAYTNQQNNQQTASNIIALMSGALGGYMRARNETDAFDGYSGFTPDPIEPDYGAFNQSDWAAYNAGMGQAFL